LYTVYTMAWLNKTFKWVSYTGVNKHGLVIVYHNICPSRI